MVPKKTIRQRVQDYSDYKREHEFFVVSTTDGERTPKKLADLESAWQRLYKNVNIPASTFRERDIFGKEEVVINLDSGLQIVDDGYNVSFRAQNEKKDVNKLVALSTIGCAANLLYRQGGFGVNQEPTTIRDGSNDFVEQFKKSYKETKQIVDREIIEKLKGHTH